MKFDLALTWFYRQLVTLICKCKNNLKNGFCTPQNVRGITHCSTISGSKFEIQIWWTAAILYLCKPEKLPKVAVWATNLNLSQNPMPKQIHKNFIGKHISSFPTYQTDYNRVSNKCSMYPSLTTQAWVPDDDDIITASVNETLWKVSTIHDLSLT